MTPMEKIKPQLIEFKELIGEQFSQLDLNKAKSKPKYSDESYELVYDGETQGVLNDFVRKYDIKFNKDAEYSMAFTFTYIGLEEKDWSVNYSIKFKNGGKFHTVYSDEYSIKEFKNKLKTINKIFKEEEEILGYDEIIEHMNNQLIDDVINKINYVKKTNVNKKRERKVKFN